MKSTRANKLIHMPEGLMLELENLKSEVHVLRRTVASKTAAVAILHKQLEAAHGDQEEIFIPLHNKLTQTDGGDLDLIKDMTLGSPERSPGNGRGVSHSSNSVLAELLSASKRENKALKQDLLDLRCKLHDAQADLKVVRSETPRVPLPSAGPLQQHWHRQERLHLIHSLEELTNKVSELEGHVRCLNVEREELLRERQHATATIARLSRQLKETRRESTAPIGTNRCDSDHTKGDGRGQTGSGTDLQCMANGIGSVEEEVVDHCKDLNSSLATSEGIKADGSENCATDVSTALLQQNRSLLVKLKEAEMELKRTKAIVADYELLSSLQAAAHHDHRTLAASAQHRSQAEAPSSSTILSNSNCAPEPAPSATPPLPAAATNLAADVSATVSEGSECVDASSSSAAAEAQTIDVASDGHDINEGSHDASLQSAVHEASMKDTCTTAAPTSDEIGGGNTRTDAVTMNEPQAKYQEESAPSSCDAVTKPDGTNATDQPDLETARQGSSPQEREPCDDIGDACRNSSNLESHSSTGDQCQAAASRTKTNEKVNASKIVPLQSLSAHAFEASTPLRSQDWLSGMDEVSSYSPYCPEGVSISDCIEEIVPIDEIDSYVEEVRREQSKRAACRTDNSKPVKDSGTLPANSNSRVLREDGSNRADGEKQYSSHPSDKMNVSSSVRNTQVSDSSNAPPAQPIDGAVEAPGSASLGTSIDCEAVNATDDAFGDYDSDDDNFEAELQQWQQSAEGLLNKAQKRGAH